MLYALTDFLVVIGVAIAVWRMWPINEKTESFFAMIGLGLFALAALVGTVRFASGAVEELLNLHGYFSRWAGAGGIVLIAVTSARMTWLSGKRWHLDLWLFSIPFIAPMVTPVTSAQTAPIALTIGMISIIALVLQRRFVPALLWLAAWGLLVFASTAIGGSREETTLGIANWHIYHALLAVWAVLVGEAVRASTTSRA